MAGPETNIGFSASIPAISDSLSKNSCHEIVLWFLVLTNLEELQSMLHGNNREKDESKQQPEVIIELI